MGAPRAGALLLAAAAGALPAGREAARAFEQWAREHGAAPDGAALGCGESTGCWGLHATRDLPKGHPVARLPSRLVLTDADVAAEAEGAAVDLRPGDPGRCLWPRQLLDLAASEGALDESAAADFRGVLRLLCVAGGHAHDAALWRPYIAVTGDPPEELPWAFEAAEAECLSPELAGQRETAVRQHRHIVKALASPHLWATPLRRPPFSEAAIGAALGRYSTRAFRVAAQCVTAPGSLQGSGGTASVLAPVIDTANMDPLEPGAAVECAEGGGFLLRTQREVRRGEELFVNYLAGSAALSPGAVWSRYGFVPPVSRFAAVPVAPPQCGPAPPDSLWVALPGGELSRELQGCAAPGGGGERAALLAVRDGVAPGGWGRRRLQLRAGHCAPALRRGAAAAAAAGEQLLERALRAVTARLDTL
eukprot:TRINITY_DN30272_c0_g1_i1.p1 TRINITY_DN30272_c0_g1~~TRINITY_DN30272_c0_g1_i1.p1  ORF type:complete len:420 (+),score=100.84 TRINITY_DN30272_c0_g1_i1:76-1335(+)